MAVAAARRLRRQQREQQHSWRRPFQLRHLEQCIESVPRTLFPQLLVLVLLQRRIRPMYLSLLLRHWPEETLSLEELERNNPRMAELFETETEQVETKANKVPFPKYSLKWHSH